MEGTIELSVVFNKEGYISNIQLIRGLGYGLDEAAIEAAKTIKFVAGKKDGNPVSIQARLEYTFSLF